jgi:hypothetical protein
MPDKEYTQRDFAHMGLQADALKDFADLLDHNYDRQADGTMLASIALIPNSACFRLSISSNCL